MRSVEVFDGTTIGDYLILGPEIDVQQGAAGGCPLWLLRILPFRELGAISWVFWPRRAGDLLNGLAAGKQPIELEDIVTLHWLDQEFRQGPYQCVDAVRGMLLRLAIDVRSEHCHLIFERR